MTTEPARLDQASAPADPPSTRPTPRPVPRTPARGTPRTLAVALPLLASLAVFVVLATMVLGHNAGFVDRPLLNGAVTHRDALLDGPMKALTHVASYPLLVVTVLGAALASRRARSWRPLLLVGATGALSFAAATLVKETTDRTRPPAVFRAVPEDGWCFPSRHTVVATAVLLMLAYLVTARVASRAARLTLWSGAVLLAALVAASRVYLAVHWATDALAGLALGTAVMLAMVTADVRVRRRGRGLRWLGTR